EGGDGARREEQAEAALEQRLEGLAPAHWVRAYALTGAGGRRAPRATPPRATRARSASGRRRRARRRPSAGTTRAPSSGAAPSPSPRGPAASSRARELPPALVDETDDAHSRLLDGELGDVDDGAAEASLHSSRLVQLLVDLCERGVAPVRRSHRANTLLADVGEPLGRDREPDDLRPVDLEQLAGRLDALDDRHVGCLVAQVAEVDGERRLRRARHADEHDVRLVQAAVDAVVVLDGELDRLDALEVRLVERRPRPGLHARRHARDARDGIDRVPEEVAVVQTRAAA